MQRLSTTGSIQFINPPAYKRKILRDTWTKSRTPSTTSINTELSNLLVSNSLSRKESSDSIDGIELISATILAEPKAVKMKGRPMSAISSSPLRRTSTISKPPSGHSRRPSLQSFTPLSSQSSIHASQDMVSDFISSSKVQLAKRPASARHYRQTSNMSESGRSAIPGTSNFSSLPPTSASTSTSSSLIGIAKSKGIFGQHYARGLIPCRVAHGSSKKEALLWEGIYILLFILFSQLILTV
jgi:hypothetical protein